MCVYACERERQRETENERVLLGYGHQMKMINFIPIHGRHKYTTNKHFN